MSVLLIGYARVSTTRAGPHCPTGQAVKHDPQRSGTREMRRPAEGAASVVPRLAAFPARWTGSRGWWRTAVQAVLVLHQA